MSAGAAADAVEGVDHPGLLSYTTLISGVHDSEVVVVLMDVWPDAALAEEVLDV